MKIVETQSAMLANHEVLSHIRAVQSKNTLNPEYSATKAVTGSDGRTGSELSGKLRGLNHVVSETIRYFEGSQGYIGSSKYTNLTTTSNDGHEPTTTLLRNLRPYNLTKTELLMLLNLRPEAIDQLEPLVEEASERFSQEQQLEIVRIIGEALGKRPLRASGVDTAG